MGKASTKEIIKQMEELKDGNRLSLRLSPTYGGRTVIIELNLSKENGQKKYLMWWGDDEVKARASDPFLSSDKAKKIASWPGDRDAEWIV